MSGKIEAFGAKTNIPQHVAIIMDGNGRWAQKRGLSRHLGHEQGAKALQHAARYAREIGIKYLTLYAFSTENWQRPPEEIDAVMEILGQYLKNDVQDLVRHGIRIRAIGQLSRLPLGVQKSLNNVEKQTKHGDKLTITLALSYGSVQEITEACKKIVEQCLAQEIVPESINEHTLRNNLSTNFLPAPDLLIRTGGDVRLSNFLLLELSYSELYFCKTLWPDFNQLDFEKAITSYCSRNRRFGNVA